MLILGLGVGIAAYPTGRVELLYLGVFLACIPLLALSFVRFRRQYIAVARRFSPATAEAGCWLMVALEVRNLGLSGTVEASWRDLLPWRPYSTAPSRLRPLAKFRGAFGRNSSVEFSYALEPPRRGIVEIGPLIVDFSDPFMLASGEISVGELQELVVAPAITSLPVTGLSMTADQGPARTRQRRISGSADELMTREYRHGDPLRRVHWRSSAHHGELMVRQDEQRSHAEAHILLDTRLAGYRDAESAGPDEPESATFEWALSFAASLALHLHGAGYTVDIVETGYRQIAPPGGRDEFLRSLAAVELVGGADSARLGRGDASGSLGSVFAVIADAEPRTVERLCAERANYGSAIAFVVNQRGGAVIDRLREAGWKCRPVSSSDDQAEVWRSASELRLVHDVAP